MIELRPAKERGHTRLDWLESYHTFSFDQYRDMQHHHFGVLRVINEDWVAPGQGFHPHDHHDMEIVTLVLEGALAHKDSLGSGSVIRPGEIQRMSAGTGITHSEFNHSPSDPVHLLQVWIFPEKRGLEPGYEQKPFDPAPAQNQWQLVVSPDGKDGSVVIHQELRIYRTFLSAGNTLTFPLAEGRQAWCQVACGAIRLNELSLAAGDGASIRQTDSLALTAALIATEASEIYLFEMAAS